MIGPQEKVYPDSSECIVIVHDLRDPKSCEALHRARAAWQERSHLEALDEDHFALIVRPGGALERAA